MKKYILGLCTFFIFGITTAQNNIDILHYRFSIHLNDQNDTITGRAKILVKALAPTHSISLDLASPKNNGKGMYVTNVSNGLKILTALHDIDIYTITLDKTLQENDTASIVIDYHGIPSDGLIISKNKYGHRTFFADNWPNRGHNWLPCHDDPADKATVDFIVTAPQHYQVVANGIQVEETNLSGDMKKTHWKEDVPISTKVMVIGAADFAVNLSGTVGDCIPVYSWVYPEDRDNGFYDYALAAKILPWYIQTVGPYAYKKLANVQSKTIFGGLENANTIFYSENSIDGRRTSESLLAHEIAHQWFGNYATEKSFAHLWLSEGFATYMTILYLKHQYGKDTAIAMLKKDRTQAIAFGHRKQLPVVNETKNYMQLLNANSYQKGGWILHMLQCDLGDSVFFESIRKYYATYGGKTAGTRDLQKVFEDISGKNLQQFFDQWLYNPVNPKLSINWRYDSKSKKINFDIKQLQDGDAFSLPLEIALICKDGSTVLSHLQLSKKEETIQITSEQKPENIILDPNIKLLFEGSIREIK